MSYVNIIGVVMIAISVLVFCISVNRYHEFKSKIYAELCYLLTLLNNKMNVTNSKVSDIISDIEPPHYLNSIKFLDDAKTNGLYKAFSIHADKMYLDKSDRELLSGYFKDMGYEHITLENEKLEVCLAQLKKKSALIKNELNKKKKVSDTVIVCIGMLVILFFI